MKVKYTFTVNDITAELDFEDCSAAKDSEYIRHEIEAQYRLLNKVNQKESDIVYKTDLNQSELDEAVDKFSKSMESLDSIIEEAWKKGIEKALDKKMNKN